MMGKEICAQQGRDGLEVGQVVEKDPSWPALTPAQAKHTETSRRPMSSGPQAARLKLTSCVSVLPNQKLR